MNGERYSSVERGNAQSLDHTLVSANLAAQVTDFAFARVNADFQELLQFFEDTPERLSDRDPSVAYFRFAADVTAPAFDWHTGRPVRRRDGILWRHRELHSAHGYGHR